MIKKGEKLRRTNRRKVFNERKVIANPAEGEGHTKRGGDVMCMMKEIIIR